MGASFVRGRGFPVALALLAAAWSAGEASGGDRIQYNRDIRPILSENCFFCHGPDKGQRKADLRLDVRNEALAHQAIVPGKPEESKVLARIASGDPDTVMPPPESNKRLTLEQIELLKRWLSEGAEYQGHWAYERPTKPQTPGGVHPIDHLVRQRLAQRGLEPSPEADRRTLARRLHTDLIGLPPKPEELDAFAADRSPEAFGSLVDKLLASPHFGERMAIAWLDAVRFADTIGYHSDNPRNVWPYRDYVIRAFNDNKPFDQFTIEQLAGDLLPESTQDQKIASCFNHLLLTTEEGGAQARDYEARMLTDRVRAVGAVWLGQTLGCCQCHDHKFDPITTRDFYSMGAFFADIREPIIGRRDPGMLVTSEDQARHLVGLQAAVTELEKKFEASAAELAAAQEAWEKAVLAELSRSGGWSVIEPAEAVAESGVRLVIEKDATVRAERDPPGGTDAYRVTGKTTLGGITGFRLDAIPHPTLPSEGPGRARSGNFVLTEFSVSDAAGTPVALAHASATSEQSGFPAAATIDGKIEGDGGWAALGMAGVESAICFELAEPIGDGSELTLTFTLRQLHGSSHTLGRFRLSATTGHKPVRAPRAVVPPPDVIEILKLDPAERDGEKKAKLTGHFKRSAPELADLRARLADSRRAQTDYEEKLPRCLVSVSIGAPRTVRILPRGNWQDETGEVVEPAVPGYLPPPGVEGRRLTRLDLAQWIASRDNPLTARVFVNRLWKQFFGTGLSKTPDDLGSQGEWPANPELLDWLACEFMDGGWSVKHLVRAIVTSHTYRQVSTASKELQARDPDNRELARQSRFRLDAELVRDNALAVSGLLVPKIGGPSVKPYQPEGYWENLNFPPRQYVADLGEDQHRRGLYTWWQRSFPHPSLLAFDSPSREECAADRSRSNIPQQALVLLNDPTYVEAARALAARIIAHGGAEADARIQWAWRQALGREPREEELAAVRRVLDKHLAAYAEAPQAAEPLLKVGSPLPAGVNPAELAAWTSVARIVLNLHETITRN